MFDPPEPEAPAARPAAPPVTPGTIACGTATCQAGPEACCFDLQTDRGRCVPTRQLVRVASEWEGGPPILSCPEAKQVGVERARTLSTCDDIGDCKQGLKCCNEAISIDGGTLEHYLCARSCFMGEVCVGKGGCSPGTDCVLHSEDPPKGSCEYRSSPQCGATRCSGEKRWCCSHDGRYRCVGREEDCPGLRLVCLVSEDCGPDDPCRLAESHGTFCGQDVSSPPTCATDADCPTEGIFAGPCVPEPDLPPGFGICVRN